MGKIVCYDCGSENCSFVDGVLQCLNCNTNKTWYEALDKLGYGLSQIGSINSPEYEFRVDSFTGKIVYLSLFYITNQPVFYIQFSQPSKLKELIMRLKLFFGTEVSILQTGVDAENVRCLVCGQDYTEIGDSSIVIGCNHNLHLSFHTPNLYYASLIEKKYPGLIRNIGQGYIQVGKITYTTKNIPGKHWYSKLETVTTEHNHSGKIEFRVKSNDPRDLAIAVTKSVLESEELRAVYTLVKNNLFPGIRLVVVK